MRNLSAFSPFKAYMAVRTTLLHNPTAGFEKFTREYLLNALKKQGYAASYVSVKEDGLQQHLQQPCNLLVVAGGDGTIRRVANALSNNKVPIGILPLGTANNIAKTLAIEGEPEDIIAGWSLNDQLSFDIGIVESAEGKKFFYESLGFGMLPRLIRQHSKDDEDNNSREEALESALQHQKEIVKEYQAHACTIRLDDETFSGDYVMLEIMNIPLAGPNMSLAPQAKPDDGLFDVVMVKENERSLVDEYLRRRLWGDKLSEPLFTTKRARHVSVKWHGIHYHIDDDSCERNAPVRLDASFAEKKLTFLCGNP